MAVRIYDFTGRRNMDKLVKIYLSNLKMQAEAVVNSSFKHDFLQEIYFF